MRIRLVAVLLGAALATAVAGCVHKVQPGYVWNLWGTVADFSQTELSVRHKSGRIVKLHLDNATIFTSDHRPAGPEALARAAHVSVDVELLADGSERAKIVRIVWGGATPPASR
jgi:hypothetical protein